MSLLRSSRRDSCFFDGHVGGIGVSFGHTSPEAGLGSRESPFAGRCGFQGSRLGPRLSRGEGESRGEAAGREARGAIAEAQLEACLIGFKLNPARLDQLPAESVAGIRQVLGGRMDAATANASGAKRARPTWLPSMP
jgi:hypothetical protein